MDQKTINNIAKNVKRLRLAGGWNQTQFGKRAGVAQTTISQLENPNTTDDEKKSPTIGTLEKIAEALNIPVWTLLIDTDAADPSTLKSLDAVVSAYTHLPSQGQTEINRVADAEARYAAVRR